MRDEAERFLTGILLCLALASGAHARTVGARGLVSEVWPPVRSTMQAPVHVPQAGELLAHNWEFTQLLYDVDTTRNGWQNYLNAFPVGIGFAQQGRGFLATLHTVFKTTDAGRTWRNLDPYPEPDYQSSDYEVLRTPYYVSSMAVRPVLRTGIGLDTVILSVIRSDADSSVLRTIYYSSAYQLWPFITYKISYWLTNVVIPDSFTACAIAGLEGRLYRNDTLAISTSWEYLDAEKGFIRSGRSDSVLPDQTWITAICYAQNLVVAVGSNQWVSRDRGRLWRIRTAADENFDSAVSFCDSSNGMTGGGTVSPYEQGWVHVSSDGARTWSGRVLETDFPIRAVQMVTPQIAFAAGGNYQENRGEIWSTTDGGVLWEQELTTDAEIRTLAIVRTSAAYIDVVAAGVFADFRGGVWQTRVYAPQSGGPVVVAEPDTVDFGVRATGVRDSLRVMLHNIGTGPDTVSTVSGSNAMFGAYWLYPSGYVLGAGDSIGFWVVLNTDSLSGTFARRLTVTARQSGSFDLWARVAVQPNAVGDRAPVPRESFLQVWPNPGNAQFAIRFAVPYEANVSLRIFDLNGRLVETLTEGRVASGEHRMIWNAENFATGIYFVRFEHGGAAQTQKLLLLK